MALGRIIAAKLRYQGALQSSSSESRVRKTIQKQLQNSQVFTTSENIFITTGSPQSLSILVNTPLPNGKNEVLVEQPACSEILNALEICNAITVGIKRNSEGINLDELENIFRNEDIKFFTRCQGFTILQGTLFRCNRKRRY